MFFIESSGQIFHYYKLQTCHPSQHFKRLLRKSQRVGQLRNLHTPIGIVTSLYYSHSLGEFIPGLLSHLSLSLSSKASPPHLWPPGCFFSQKTVSSSGNPPPTHSWMRVLSQPVAQTVGGSLFCAASHWGNQTQSYSSHQPLVAKKQERFLPLSLCFYFSHCWFPLPFGHLAHTPCIRIHTQSNQPSLKAVLVCTLRCSAGC